MTDPQRPGQRPHDPSGGRRPRRLARRLVTASAALTGTVTSARTRERAVALTFDDGPDPEVTPRLCQLLEAHGARGTFFMVGRSAVRWPEVVARVAAGGPRSATTRGTTHRSGSSGGAGGGRRSAGAQFVFPGYSLHAAAGGPTAACRSSHGVTRSSECQAHPSRGPRPSAPSRRAALG
jgi:peptidoglycan/xylan/chitin deacetylase (PgdA/CDA1 family)